MTNTTDPVLSRITIYPVKSLDGMELQNATISAGGCLKHDRQFALSDELGNLITGKSNPLVHTLRSSVDFDNEIISFRPVNETTWKHFHLQNEKPAMESFLSDYFGMKTFLLQNDNGRFLDIPDISGVTILSTASLQEIANGFDHISLEETRKRFRATLEIDLVPAFWEDHLFSGADRAVEFILGDVTLLGMSPRARCVVPTRNPETGVITHAFPKSFARHRATTLPEWSRLEEHGHYYFLSVDCLIPASEIGKTIEVGNKIKIIGDMARN